MEKIEIEIAETEDDLLIIEKLADTIWREHYISIIGLAQVDYMLEKYQSVEAMKVQLKNQIYYYLILFDKIHVGYISFKKNTDAIFLSKIYVLQSFRGKKIGKVAMSFVENTSRQMGFRKIVLTVNKFNENSIKAYEKLGFINVESMVTDIGNGFVMDDFKMVKSF